MTEKFTAGEIKAALKRYHGAIYLAAEALGTSRQNLHQRINRSEELQRFVAEIEAALLDEAECGLASAVKAHEPWAIRYVLATKGRDRGYGRPPRTEYVRIPDEAVEALIRQVGGDVEIYRREIARRSMTGER